MKALLFNWSDAAMRAHVVQDAAMRRGADTTTWAMTKMEKLRSYEDHYRNMEHRIPAPASQVAHLKEQLRIAQSKLEKRPLQ